MTDKKKAAFDEILKEDYTEEERERIVKEWATMWPDAAAYYEEMKKLALKPVHEIPKELRAYCISGTVTGRLSCKKPNTSSIPMPCGEIDLGPSQPCVLPMPEPQEKVVPKPRIFIADHFVLDMIKEAGALEQGRISRGEALLFAHLADFEVCSLIHDERMANVLTDLLQVQLVVDRREDKHFVGIGEVIIFVEETLAGFQFWRLDVLKETRAMGSGKKAWSW